RLAHIGKIRWPVPCTWSYICDPMRAVEVSRAASPQVIQSPSQSVSTTLESIMKDKIAFLLLMMFAATATFAAQGKQVTYSSGSDKVQGMLYTPSGKGPFPAIIVIHEWWGLNDWVKQQASKLADQGYVALAVDLYRGKVATTPDEAHEIMRGVPQ